MNDNDKEQIIKIIADKFDRKLKQFLAEKQIEVNKGGSDNQEIYHLDLKSELNLLGKIFIKNLIKLSIQTASINQLMH